MNETSLTEPTTVWITWTTFCCSGCGLHWAVDARWIEARRADGKGFYCPNGCRRVYRETDLDRERKARERAEHEAEWLRTSRKAALDQAETAERRRRAAKGQLTKVKNRVANGVCPCCNRTFADLARHMTTKHPDYAATALPASPSKDV